ncbi:MAG: hypothetical protein MJZ11_12805 [Lachnospiraceae bacterium]|nr:hypothetical protein [Lachnospiraceae bacterium]
MANEMLNVLKEWYGDKVESSLFRNSPIFGKIGKERIEGKSYNFPALAGFNGGVGGDYTKALANAAKTGATAQFAVTPGQVFGAVSFSAKEELQSKTNRGAFCRIADAKLFTSFDQIQKVLATALYGRGYGEVCRSGWKPASNVASGESVVISSLPEYAMMTFVPGMEIDVKSDITSSAVIVTLAITEANGNAITAIAKGAVTSAALATSNVLCVAGAMNGAEALLPMGLAGWLPNVAKRTGANWTTYVKTKFFSVDRSANQDALCGAYYDGSAVNEEKKVAVQKLLRKVRRQGSKADIILMNDEDWANMSTNLDTTNSYFTQTSSKAKKTINAGVAEMTAAFSTNFIENIIDDPFCPVGRFYILDSDKVKFVGYSNAEKALDTGIAGNEPGSKEFTEDGSASDKPYALLIDDILTLQPGTAGVDGPTTVVGINVYGSFVITNPAKCGVGNFYNTDDLQALATA